MSIKILMTTAALLTLGCFGFESSAQAGLLGKTLSIGLYTSSSLTTPLAGTSVSFSVSGSIEIDKWQSSLNGPASIDVSDTQIKIANIAESTSFPWNSPRYIGFKDVNGTIDDFSTDILKTFFSHTVPGISNSSLIVTANSIAINVSSISLPPLTPDGYITVNVGFANPTPVPEPSMMSLFSGIVLWLLRRSFLGRKTGTVTTTARRA